MAGFVPHQNRDEWHGQTVVVFTSGPHTVIGRWDAVVGDRVTMRDVAVHESGTTEGTPDEWVAKLQKFGVPVEHGNFAVPHATVTKVVRLRDA